MDCGHKDVSSSIRSGNRYHKPDLFIYIRFIDSTHSRWPLVVKSNGCDCFLSCLYLQLHHGLQSIVHLSYEQDRCQTTLLFNWKSDKKPTNKTQNQLIDRKIMLFQIQSNIFNRLMKTELSLFENLSYTN